MVVLWVYELVDELVHWLVRESDWQWEHLLVLLLVFLLEELLEIVLVCQLEL